MKETIEMLDGRTYLTDDNWQTIRVTKRDGRRSRLLTNRGEIDTVRFLAVAQSSASA